MFEVVNDMCGTYWIRSDGMEIEIDTHKLTVEDLRELLQGFGNLFQGIATTLWDKEFVQKRCIDKEEA